MKKSLVWVVLLGVALTFNSCDKDSDPEPAIAGIWTRNIYEFTELPTGFTKYWEGYEVSSWGETGYTIVFRSDGTYKRAFTIPPPDVSLNDIGKWTLDGTTLKLTPDKSSDLDIIDDLGPFPGTEFTVVGDISSGRLTLSQVITLGLPSDAALDAADGDPSAVPDEEIKSVDVTVVYKFDKIEI